MFNRPGAWQPKCMSVGVAELGQTHRCSGCGALYDVVFVDKRLCGDERIICDCGWPLKDWISYKAYVFTRRTDAADANEAA